MTPAEKWNLQHGHDNHLMPNNYKVESQVDAFILNRMKLRKMFEQYQEQKKMQNIIDETVEKTVEKQITKQIQDIFK